MRLLAWLLTIAVPISHTRAWRWNPQDEHPCNVPQQMTHEQLIQRFGPSGVPPLYSDPIIIRANHSRNTHFKQLTQKDALLEFFGPDFHVTLSSSNSLSENRRTIPLPQYVDEILTAQETLPDQLSNETWYLFGETFSDDWKKLLDYYELPLCYSCVDWPVALAFGIGNRGSGVQCHIHGPGFSESIHGRKHWILYPPDRPPPYHKDQSSRQWMETAYFVANPPPMECTLNPGDLIYFPDQWWHATINLDPYTVFISSFTTEHGVDVKDEL